MRPGSRSAGGRVHLVHPGAGLGPTTTAWVFVVSRAVRSEAGAAQPGRRSPLSSPAAGGVSRGPSAFPGRLGAGLEFDPAGRARALEAWGSLGAAHPGLPALADESRPRLVTLELQIKRAIF